MAREKTSETGDTGEPGKGKREPIRLQGFNNLTKSVSFNLYDFAVARDESERAHYLRYLHEHFSGDRITAILRRIAEIIDAEVLSVSTQDYDPYGASSLVLMSDSVGAHLSKSHLCAHTYPDVLDPRGLCTFRVDIDIATCGTIVPLRALDYMIESFENDVAIIDYAVRGFTRDADGKRIYMDHALRSIQDFIDPALLAAYAREDMNLPDHNLWQTKLMRTKLEPADYFSPGVDVEAPENRALFEALRREMIGIHQGIE